MYEVFEDLLKANNVSSYRISKDLGIPTSTLSDWKRGVTTPKSDKLQKIADYFNVSLDYLTTGREKDSEIKGAEDFVLLKKIHSLNSANYKLLVNMIDTMIQSQLQ